MKKLMFAAAMVAAMTASADYSVLGVYSQCHVFFSDDVEVDVRQQYNQAFVVSASDYSAWQSGDKGLGDVTKLITYTLSYQQKDGKMFAYFNENSSGGKITKDNVIALAGGVIEVGRTVPAETTWAIVYNSTTEDAFGIPSAEVQIYEMYSSFAQVGKFDYGLPNTGMLWYTNESNPYSVPEPTSALLMLLGMAGLALRRKQA